MIHELKITSQYFKDVQSELKSFEVRKNDRDFKVGDYLALNEIFTDTKEETGRSLLVKIVYILNNPQFVKDGFVIIGIEGCKIVTRGGFEIPKITAGIPIYERGNV